MDRMRFWWRKLRRRVDAMRAARAADPSNDFILFHHFRSTCLSSVEETIDSNYWSSFSGLSQTMRTVERSQVLPSGG